MNRKTIRRALRLIGPYPYNPLLIFLFFFAFYFSRFIPIIVEQPRGSTRWLSAVVVLAISLVPSSLFAILALVIQKYRRWSDQSLIIYIFEVATGQSILFLCSPLIRLVITQVYHFKYVAPLTLTPGFFLGSLILVLIALGLLHSVERSIEIRHKIADDLVVRLEADRRQLILSDEVAREQTSRFLHDRVQSDLMVIAMKLKSISGLSSPDVNEKIESAISQLEYSRTIDLKEFVQVPSPNFEVGGLLEALGTLIGPYKSTMDIALNVVGSTADLNAEQLLGIYRITEQCLLNSLIHGPASRVQIDFKI